MMGRENDKGRREVWKGNEGSQQCHTAPAGDGVLSLLSCSHPWRFLEEASSFVCQPFQI